MSTAASTVQDGAAAAVIMGGAYFLILLFDSLTARKLIEQSLSRKVVHVVSGLLFMSSWPFFSSSPEARYFAAIVPLVNCMRLISYGLCLVTDDGFVKSITREGNPEELLRGPLYYVLVLMFCVLVFWRDSPVGILVLAMMSGGDGFADIVGRRYGTLKLPHNRQKSWAGSISMFIVGFLSSVGSRNFGIWDPGPAVPRSDPISKHHETTIKYRAAIARLSPHSEISSRRRGMMILGAGNVSRLQSFSSFRVSTAAIRCSSSSSSAATSTTSLDHVSFVTDVAATRPPQHLTYLLNLLQARGETIVPPGAKEGLIPLVIPLSESPSGALTSLLRWPTSPSGMEMPVVEVRKHGVWFLAKSVDQYIHRMLVEEDASNCQRSNGKLWDVSSEVGRKIYKKGDLVESGIDDLDIYLLKKVGLFPDVLERKVAHHLEKGDHVSALVTGEFYTRNHFPGFGRPFVFNAEVLLKVGRNPEAKDAARGALKSPWWTLGCGYQEVAKIAQWEDEQIEYIKEKVTEEGKLEDLKKGKPPEQVALDEAAFLLDLASIEGNWDEIVNRVAACYEEAGLHHVAKFVMYRE